MVDIVILCVFAFAAGLIDAAVGGGGLIQIPALFNVLPTAQPAALLGTNKVAAACGTTFAARSFVRKVVINWGLVIPAACAAFVMAFFGAATVSFVPQSMIRPAVLVLIVLMAIYTFWKKDFGALHKPVRIGTKEKLLAIVIGGAIGFYDGLFGPGTGSFLIFLFIRCFAFDFLHASASAKLVNIATNVAALMFFIPTGNVLYLIAIPMAAFNILGALTGTWLAVHKGVPFVRALFLVLLVILISKLSYDMLL
ncbi:MULTISPECIES: sulfite exporter TauE/SafE family protein [Pseudomonas]|uniref:Probable membrane transporter protein n=1 Tax=Pseudomonas protegens TaxID=380021 RepID=A0A7G8YPX2_9PSED|nr:MULTISPECIES: TSUP family transporter [Pseudomonas]RBJ85931.1 sulfite exporter TauE/SafE family protein [Pseudomonas sp. MWU12-2534b]MDF2397398.1 TSUP family transporter [Pseudomonas sp. 3MA1]MDP9527569.1 TSUP family transporter [Pseudomonas protegens]QNH77720.1 TSUP family transporter [Pseudomonas protegens]QNL06916.1 TSUP family transporter [Pseudomonas protegens]